MSTVFAIQLLDALSAILMETAVTGMDVDRGNIFRMLQHTRALATNLMETAVTGMDVDQTDIFRMHQHTRELATNLREIPLGSIEGICREIATPFDLG